jgi:hypothetical protein
MSFADSVVCIIIYIQHETKNGSSVCALASTVVIKVRFVQAMATISMEKIAIVAGEFLARSEYISRYGIKFLMKLMRQSDYKIPLIHRTCWFEYRNEHIHTCRSSRKHHLEGSKYGLPS